MAKILGLDLGTNSIGWAVIDNETKQIEAAGSRIIPMDAGRLGDFEKGNSVSFTAERTQYRGMRRLHERFLLKIVTCATDSRFLTRTLCLSNITVW